MFDDFAAKQLGSEAAKSVMGNTESILAPMAGEEAIVHERLASVTSAGEGEIAAKFVKDVRAIRRKDDKFETEKVVLVDSSSEHESIVGWGCYPNNEKSIQSNPSLEFLNSLPFIKKFYPAPLRGEGKVTEIIHEIAAIHVIPSDSEGI